MSSSVERAATGVYRIWGRPIQGWLVLLVVAIIAGAVLRFVNLGGKIWWFDEVFTSLPAAGNDEQSIVNPAIVTGEPLSPDEIGAFMRLRDGSSAVDTVNVLIRRDPKWPPLYQLTVRLWMHLIGDDAASLRLLSALFGVLTIPAMGWLCWQLFADRRVMWTGMALIALSPFFVRHSQEGRATMLTVLLMLLMNGALLRALRQRNVGAWVIYGALLAVGLYTNLIVGFVLACHALYMFAVYRHSRRVIAAYFLATAAAVVSLSPWLWVMYRYRRTVLATSRHLADGLSLENSVIGWLNNVSQALFAWEPTLDGLLFWLALIVAGLISFGCYRLYRETPRQTWLFVVLQIGLALLVITPDILLGGRVSLTGRYFLSVYIAALIALAYAFSRPGFGRRVLSLVLIGSFSASLTAVLSPTWWGLTQVDEDVVEILNANAPALVITTLPYGVIAMLTARLNPETRIIFAQPDEVPAIPTTAQNVYLYEPPSEFLAVFAAHYDLELALVYEKPRWDEIVYQLYQVQW